MNDSKRLTDDQLSKIAERDRLSRSSGGWADLAHSANDVPALLRHIAWQADQLDGFREAVLNVGNERDDLFDKVAETRNHLAAAQATIARQTEALVAWRKADKANENPQGLMWWYDRVQLREAEGKLRSAADASLATPDQEVDGD